jgi:N-carbamoyl-L-amino-acid hydrolase
VKPLALDSRRLQQRIDALAAISESEPPGVTRVLFSQADLEARAVVKNWCNELALVVREDGLGNLFARWPGKDPYAPPVATGSHIDAIPNSGRYDGVVGVIGGIDAIRILMEAGFEPARSIELIVFTAEEPTRFGIGCLGSRVLAGAMAPSRAEGLLDSNSRSLGDWRKQAGFGGMALESVPLTLGHYAAFIELHIEQGPVLESEKLRIGIVEKIAGPAALRINLTGIGGHAGAILMPDRHDAMLAGAEIALAAEQAALTSGSPDTVATTGVFRIQPGAINSVPCEASLEIDLRDTQLPARNAALSKIEKAVHQTCQRRGVKAAMARLHMDNPADCDRGLMTMAQEICRAFALPAKTIISRAYHDALFMARICRTTMLFIPSRGGFSHRPDEFSSPEQIADGVRVLAEMICRLAGNP